MEQLLLAYGPLGAWTIYLIYEKQTLFKKLVESLDKLSKAIEKSRLAHEEEKK